MPSGFGTRIVEKPLSRQSVIAGPEADPVRRQFLQSGDGARVLAERTTYVDAVVRDSFDKFLLPVYPRGMAALAVGGYGRCELFPHSDIDLLLLEANPPDTDRKSVV